MFKKKCALLHQQFRKLVACYNKQKGGGGELTFTTFGNEFLSLFKKKVNWP